MAERILTFPAEATVGRSRVAASWRRLPVAVRITAIYVAARAVTVGFILLAGAMAPPDGKLGSGAPLADFALAWDAQWYWLVAVDGYPVDLPRDAAGHVTENAWAFMPVYAYLSLAVGAVLGGGAWGAGAFAVSFVSGWLACLVLHRLLRERQGEREAMWAVALFACGPLAGLFHAGYAESLFLLLLFLALLCLTRRRWGWLYLLVPVMGYTRPGILAFALLLGLYGIMRGVRRRADPLEGREIVHIVALGVIATAVGFSWQALAGVVTGEPGAYLDTELAWRRAWVGTEHFLPLEGWFQAAGVWFGVWGLPAWLAPVAVVALVVALAALLLWPEPVRRTDPIVRLWSASYLVYLLLVFFPQSSVFRLLVPLSPLWGAVAALRSRWVRIGALALCLLGQWWWIWNMYGQGSTFWQIP